MRFNRKRSGVSEFIAALIMIAITLVAGTAAFGWILLQAGSSEQSYGNSVAQGVNYLNERVTLVSQSFSTGPGACSALPAGCTNANFWLYNTGNVGYTLFTIRVENVTDPPDNHFVNIVFSSTAATVYSKAGATVACAVEPGWSGGAVPLGIGALSSTPFKITMPTGCPAPYGPFVYLFDGTTYTVSITGLYGSVVTESITPNG